MKLFRNILIILFSVALIGADASDAWKRVREGIDAFRSGDFTAADEAFEKAGEAKIEDGRIPFNRGCTKAKLDDTEAALDFFRDAARDPVAGLSADSHYNMGCLAADKAKGVFGDDPAAADQETRVEGLRHLQTAIVHYRDARRLDTDHENARHNLEVIRLWVKQMQAVWEQRDREKERQEKNLLQFLAHIEQLQMEIRRLSQVLDKEKDSPRRRQAVMQSESEQRRLAEEILPLKEKIRAELQPQPPQATTPANPNASAADAEKAEQIQKAITLLTGLADKARDAMVRSADHMEQQLISESLHEQQQVLRQLNQIYMAVAPFPSLIQRAVNEQQQLHDESPAATHDDLTDSDQSQNDTDQEKNPDTTTTSAASGPQYDFSEAGWKQSRLADYGEVLGPKADHELQAVEAQLAGVTQQLASLPADESRGAVDDTAGTEDPDDDVDNNSGKTDPKQDDPNSTPSTKDPDLVNSATSNKEDAAPSQREQLETAQQQAEQMKAALQLAVEYGPEIHDRSKSAADSLTSDDAAAALPDQTEALRMLKEIQAALPKNEQQQNQDDNQDQQQQNQDQQNKDQKQNKDDKEQQKDEDQKHSEDKQPSEDQKQQDKQQKDKQQRDASREKAEAMLRKVRERERKHRALKDELRRALMPAGQVERDW